MGERLRAPRPPQGPSCSVTPVGCVLWLGILLLAVWGFSALALWIGARL